MNTLASIRPTVTVRLATPLGEFSLEGHEEALVRIDLPGTPARAPLAGDRVPGAVEEAARQLGQYLEGDRRRFDLPLELVGTSFQKTVWLALAEIPYGSTVSYAELASMVGRPRSCRPVGQANGANPIPVVLPCHRVVASGGGLGGYGGGLGLKRALLALEHAPLPATIRPSLGD